jgi:hypothetical protein
MKLAIVLSLLPVLALSNPIAAPDAEPVAEALDVRAEAADKWCKVITDDVRCREGAGTGYDRVRYIQPSDNFGVRCKAYGETIEGNRYVINYPLELNQLTPIVSGTIFQVGIAGLLPITLILVVRVCFLISACLQCEGETN